ncbi:MAG: RluA family pseudouridine synthase [Oscillospiraceae bacterium]|nr:RluA family pseudouridine synthase [Oscillospiraceae bacterium]
MTEKHIEITAQESGDRIDALLAFHPDIRSRSQAARLLEQGLVTINGVAVGKSRRVTAGETISVTIPEATAATVLAQDIPLDVVYEDGDVIVVNKPRGMVVHPAPGHPDETLVNALLAHCGPSLSGVGGEMRPGIVHRIDKDTSGLIIAAKNDRAHQALSAQLKDRSLSRIYDAVVHGPIHDDAGTVNAPIGRDPRNRQKMAVTDKNSRPAVTHWEVLARYSRYTYVRCRLETGRTHQIRVHMAHISHPLLGDTVYGGRRDKGLETQCLHARGLKFIHPATGEQIQLWTDLPDWFQTVLDKLGPPME